MPHFQFLSSSTDFSSSPCKLDHDVFLALGDYTAIDPVSYPNVHCWTHLILSHSEGEQTRSARLLPEKCLCMILKLKVVQYLDNHSAKNMIRMNESILGQES